jgi:hypothetical protein
VADPLSAAMLVLQSLSPEQRAVLLLHDVFDYGFAEIATIVGNEMYSPGLGSPKADQPSLRSRITRAGADCVRTSTTMLRGVPSGASSRCVATMM